MNVTVGVLRPEGWEDFMGIIPNSLRDQIFAAPQSHLLLGATAEGYACGVLIAEQTGSEVRIHYLQVVRAFRRMNCGGMMLDALVQSLDKLEYFTMLRCTFTAAMSIYEHDPMYRLFTGRGFEVAPVEGRTYTVELGRLADMPFWQGVSSPSAAVRSFAELPEPVLRAFVQRLRRHLQAPDFRLYAKESLRAEASFAYLVDGKIEAVAVVSDEAGSPELSWLYYLPAKKDSTAACLPHLLRRVYRALLNAYPPEAVFRIAAVNDVSIQLVEKLCPGASFLPLLEAVCDLEEYRSRRRGDDLLAAILQECEKNLGVMTWLN